jgi:hypothetical protein
MRACTTLLDRIKPVKEKMENPSWEALIKACDRQGIDLRATHLLVYPFKCKEIFIKKFFISDTPLQIL